MQPVTSNRRACALHDAAARRLYANRRTRALSAYLTGYVFEFALKAAFFGQLGVDPKFTDVTDLAKNPAKQANRTFMLPNMADPNNPRIMNPNLPSGGPLGHSLAL